MKNNINKTIKIIYEDMDLIAINKPAGLLVHDLSKLYCAT